MKTKDNADLAIKEQKEVLLGSDHFHYQIPGWSETTRGMKTAPAGIPGYELHRTFQTKV